MNKPCKRYDSDFAKRELTTFFQENTVIQNFHPEFGRFYCFGDEEDSGISYYYFKEKENHYDCLTFCFKGEVLVHVGLFEISNKTFEEHFNKYDCGFVGEYKF